ncbi:hypothetical protein NC653_027704 [Populus alba x Populus x berolinensis]|uniref:ABC transporter domain-containing protein n=1 Tax=Populus alba x Populus x berolinensis TaxID=444605 RepID=A0AAD6M8G9_9ROSI|nr:hypothetical protein NC653_027704 [Populus alba x Populus x berolinensis]
METKREEEIEDMSLSPPTIMGSTQFAGSCKLDHACAMSMHCSLNMWSARIGFVTQYDVLLPQLTVDETLVFAAFLRLPGNISRQQRYARVEMIIKELGLER